MPRSTFTVPLFTRLKLPLTVLAPGLLSVPALVTVSAWQQPFQVRFVLPFPSVSVPPLTVLRLAAPPWLFARSVASRVTFPAARSSRVLVRTTLPVTVPVLPDATTVMPLPLIAPPLQVSAGPLADGCVTVRVPLPLTVPLPLSVRLTALSIAAVPPFTAPPPPPPPPPAPAPAPPLPPPLPPPTPTAPAPP